MQALCSQNLHREKVSSKTHHRRFSKNQTPIASISTKKTQQTMIIRANVFRSKMKKKVKNLYCRPKQIFSDQNI